MVDKKKVNKRVIQITDGVLASSLRNDLGEYLITIERLLEEQKPGYEYFEGQLDEYAKRDAPNEEELYKQVFYEDQHRYTEEFPRLLYNSCLLTAISSLEFELGIICKRIKEQREFPISWKELKGDTLEQAKRFCEIAGVNLTENNPDWQEIQIIYRIRNCIIHNNCIMENIKDEKILIKYAKENHIISSDDKEISLTKEYCKEVITLIDNFTLRVWDKVYKIRPIIKKNKKA